MSVVSLVNQTVACHKFDHTGVFMAGRQGEVNLMSMLFNWNSFFRDYLLYKDKNATRKDKRGKCRINKDYSIKGERNSGNTKGMKIGGKNGSLGPCSLDTEATSRMTYTKKCHPSTPKPLFLVLPLRPLWTRSFFCLWVIFEKSPTSVHILPLLPPTPAIISKCASRHHNNSLGQGPPHLRNRWRNLDVIRHWWGGISRKM